MYYITLNTIEYSARDSEIILSLQKEFREDMDKLSKPPKSPEDIRFIVVKNDEGDYITNAAINYLNSRDWEFTGGSWLNKVITLSSGVKVKVAALWWKTEVLPEE